MPIDIKQGRIHSLNRGRGFGFIRVNEGGLRGTDYFFHRSEVVAPLTYEGLCEGDAVIFEGEATARGPRATRVEADPSES